MSITVKIIQFAVQLFDIVSIFIQQTILNVIAITNICKHVSEA